MGPARMSNKGSALSMCTSLSRGGKGTSPGANLKPMFDGTFKEAEAHLEVYTLEHENGSVAKVDTKTATCISWKTADGTEQITQGAGSAHTLNGAEIKGDFVPEERAKKMTFDRMIFKVFPENDGFDGLEYRVDVTMRADALEYDVTVKNTGAAAIPLDIVIKPNFVSRKLTATKGLMKEIIDGGAAATSGKWDVPASKFGETEGFCGTGV